MTTTPRRDPYAPFRPRLGVVVARVFSIVVAVTFTYAAIMIPGQEGQKRDWTIADRLLILIVGWGIAWFLHRYATIRAVPTKDGLAIRNILRSRTVAWSEIFRLQFGGGAPWVLLDLADTDQVAVMAIQKVDGARSDAEASRLAALIQVHGEAREPLPRRMRPNLDEDPYDDGTAGPATAGPGTGPGTAGPGLPGGGRHRHDGRDEAGDEYV